MPPTNFTSTPGSLAKRRKPSADVPTELENSSEKLNQPTRALRACDGCRKQKTRCFKTSPVAVCCIRCLSVGAECSFEKAYKSANPGVKIIGGIPEHLTENLTVEVVSSGSHDYIDLRGFDFTDRRSAQKLDFLCGSVSRILEILQEQNEAHGSGMSSDVKLLLDAASSMKQHIKPQNDLSSSSDPLVDTPAVEPLDDNNGDEESPSIILGPSKTFTTSPFNLVANHPETASRPISNLLRLRSLGKPPAIVQSDPDVIDAGILTKLEVIDLMNDFRSNYGRWVSFPSELSTSELIESVRQKSPFLITTCCCLSLRYSLNGKPNPGDIDSHRRKKMTYKLLIRHLLRDLNKVLLKLSCFQGCEDSKGDIENLQAMVILSIYAMSLSSIACSTVDADPLLDDELSIKELNMDSWCLSGTALTAFISKSTFGTLLYQSENATPDFTFLFNRFDPAEYQTLTMFRIYNHLILNHLASCLFSGRMCIIDQIRLSYCNLALSLPSATNFDGRMVSEIGILLITYNYLQLDTSPRNTDQVEASYSSVMEEIKSWYEQWEYLFSQPAVSFVESTLSFCCILVHLNYTYDKVALTNKKSYQAYQTPIDNLSNVVEDCDRVRLGRIISSAYYLVEFAEKIENDSYYAYLSDQIHFFFYFGCIVLLKSLSHLKASKRLYFLEDQEDLKELSWKDALVKAYLLIEKLSRICQDNPSDLLTSYRDGLLLTLKQNFPKEVKDLIE